MTINSALFALTKAAYEQRAEYERMLHEMDKPLGSWMFEDDTEDTENTKETERKGILGIIDGGKSE